MRFLHLGKRAAKIGAGATVGVLATPFVLTTGLGGLGFTAGGVAAGKFPSFGPLVIQHPISHHFKARLQRESRLASAMSQQEAPLQLPRALPWVEQSPSVVLLSVEESALQLLLRLVRVQVQMKVWT
jgi:hypothetical protein